MFKFLSMIYLIYLVTLICFNEENATAQNIGITFTYSVALQDNLEWPFSIAANLENIMFSLELQYIRTKS